MARKFGMQRRELIQAIDRMIRDEKKGADEYSAWARAFYKLYHATGEPLFLKFSDWFSSFAADEHRHLVKLRDMRAIFPK